MIISHARRQERTWGKTIASILLVAAGMGLVAGAVFERIEYNQAYPTEVQTVVVRPGDTLWGIAKEAVPGYDPRITIERIKKLNRGTEKGIIRPGDVLVVPKGR